ncbi:hypothetical protein QTP81_07935 [Alteromonas sp. ASW11-36]|uniref:Energy transducer TonB n=1 Tax=Alteromonas arenosi TaxID=3055817 RepID=A0ABT7SWH8_9ALTE|nr:hypothetical protein [Alteromonas sp. ASW11-36]MDM7860523.1 hypothetical protein [Alteromonas sp. ASW11-36]
MNMKKALVVTAGAVLSYSLVFEVIANQKLRLKTDVIATVIESSGADDGAWQRAFPETLTMTRGMERAGVKGCGIFNLQVDAQGNVQDVDTDIVVPSFGIRRHARDYLESWQWEPTGQSGTVKVRLDFCIGGATNDEVREICEYQATLPCSNKRS